MNIEDTKFYQSIITSPITDSIIEPSIALLSVIRENYKNENWSNTYNELKTIFNAVKHEHLKKLINYLLSHEKETKELLYKTKNQETMITIIINATSIKIKTTNDNKKYLEWIKQLNNEIKNLYETIKAHNELINENDSNQKNMRVQNLLTKSLSKDFKKQITQSINIQTQIPAVKAPKKAVLTHVPKKPVSTPAVITNKNEQLLKNIQTKINEFFIDDTKGGNPYDLYRLVTDLITQNKGLTNKEFIDYLLGSLSKINIQRTNRLGILITALINNCNAILPKEFTINVSGINYLGFKLKKNRIKITIDTYRGENLCEEMSGGEIIAKTLITDHLASSMDGGRINAEEIACKQLLTKAKKGLINAKLIILDITTTELNITTDKNVKLTTEQLININKNAITTKSADCKATIIVNRQELTNNTPIVIPNTPMPKILEELKNKELDTGLRTNNNKIMIKIPDFNLNNLANTNCEIKVNQTEPLPPINLQNEIKLVGAPIKISTKEMVNLVKTTFGTVSKIVSYKPLGNNLNVTLISLPQKRLSILQKKLTTIDNTLMITPGKVITYIITILTDDDLRKVTGKTPDFDGFLTDYTNKYLQKLTP